jgi:hypothetical protein
MILEVANLNIRPGESADFERALAEAQAISAGDTVSTDRQRISGLLKRMSGCGLTADAKTSQVLLDNQALADSQSS